MANVPIYNLTDTWNAGGTTFDAIKMAVTDTASASGSRLLELLVDSGGGAASKFRVDKAGNVTIAGTLGVTGAATLSSTLAVTGLATIAGAIVRTNVGDGISAANSCLEITNSTTAAVRSPNGSSRSVFIGYNVARNVDTSAFGNGANCVGIGYLALEALTTGNNNFGIGTNALKSVTTGSQNTAIGFNALNTVSTTNDNVAIGNAAGSVAVGAQNTFIGSSAANTQTSGDFNIAIGRAVALDSLTGSYQINIGNRYFHDRLQFQAAGLSTAGDCILLREAANQLAMRNGANAQTFRLYNTYTDGSNYERGIFAWDSNVLKLGTAKAGSGVARALELQTDGTTAVTLTTGQKAEFAATIKTAAPTGGTAAEWKLGTVASVTPTSPDRTIEVEIGGTTYYLAAKTTND